MDAVILVIFLIVYVGMILGRIPGLALDRTGVALLGAIALMVFGRVTTHQLPVAVDLSTIALLFGLMVLSSQFRLAGTYSHLVRHIGAIPVTPPILLALIIALSAILSAVLVNDIVCLAAAPVVIDACRKRHLDPRPYLLALACASNIGSAATLIGNPQNILIGQVLDLSFSAYLMEAFTPVAISLFLLWMIISHQFRGRWEKTISASSETMLPFSLWQTLKGVVVLGVLLWAFLDGRWPRELVALGAAGIVLTSRRMRSREMLSLVDWQLLVLFLGLFVVNFAVNQASYMTKLIEWLAGVGVNLHEPAWLFGAGVVLSNLVSNVPAVMLLLPSATHPLAGLILALSSTLAGNLLIVGSIANIIVLDQANQHGVRIGWREHARTGVPVTIATLAVTALWLWIRTGLLR